MYPCPCNTVQGMVTAFYMVKAIKYGVLGRQKSKENFMKKVKLEPDLRG